MSSNKIAIVYTSLKLLEQETNWNSNKLELSIGNTNTDCILTIFKNEGLNEIHIRVIDNTKNMSNWYTITVDELTDFNY